MSRDHLLFVGWLAILAVLWGPAAAHGSEGAVRLGLFVGSDIGLGQDAVLRYAESEARDLAGIFQEHGGMSRERTWVLQRPDAAGLRRAMRVVDEAVAVAEAEGRDVLLVFFYSGHASRRGLHLSGEVVPMDEVHGWLEGSRAALRVAFVDACESGSLARLRGGVPVAPVDIVVDETLTMNGLAVVTSTGPWSVARESDLVGGGVFSQALMAGLRGEADRDVDGVVTLDEAYRHAFEATVTESAHDRGAVQRPEVHWDLAGVGQVALTQVPDAGAAILLGPDTAGTYSVVSLHTGRVVNRVDKRGGEARRIRVPNGRYLVRKSLPREVRVMAVDLSWGGERRVDEERMRPMSVERALSRGSAPTQPVRLGIGGTFSAPFANEDPPAAGAELRVQIPLSSGFQLDAFAGTAWGSRWEGERGMSVSRFGAGLRRRHALRRVDVSYGAGLGVAHHTSFGEGDEDFEEPQWLVGAWGVGGLHVPLSKLSDRLFLDVETRVHLHRPLGEGSEFLGELQPSVGVSFALGGRSARSSRAP